MENIYILLPVYDDWDALILLIRRIRQCVNEARFNSLFFTVVDDCSSTEFPKTAIDSSIHMEIVHLNRNIGHQKAIAIGLAYIAEQHKCDAVIVMDTDGEDRPEDIEKLIDSSIQNPGKIIFAERSKRHEGLSFKLFYKFYKFIFRILTGKSIAFGNLCIIPHVSLKKVVHLSEIWNHLASGIIKSKLNYTSIPTERGKRLSGKSKMNFISLVLHGLSAVAVHIDIVAARLLIVSILMIFLSFAGIVAVSGIKTFTNLNIPDWATSAEIGLSIIFLQAFLITLFLIFHTINYGKQMLFIPAIHYKNYILEIENLRC